MTPVISRPCLYVQEGHVPNRELSCPRARWHRCERTNNYLIGYHVWAVGGTRTLFTSHFWGDYEHNLLGNTWHYRRSEGRTDWDGGRTRRGIQSPSSERTQQTCVEIFGVGGGHFSGKGTEMMETALTLRFCPFYQSESVNQQFPPSYTHT